MPEVGARDIRKFIYDRFRDTTRAPVVEEIMEHFALDRRRVVDALRELESARQLALVPGTERILMAHPFSAIATPFRVESRGGRRYFANCAWDAIAFHVLLEEPIAIDSYCHHCGETVEIRLADGAVQTARPASTLVYLGLPAAKWWENIVLACSNTMLFFGSAAHLDDWLAAEPKMAAGQALSIDQAIGLSLPIYRGKLAVDYERPSAAVLSNHFRALGLTGPFWELPPPAPRQP
jgi:Alkylmercury lyase